MTLIMGRLISPSRYNQLLQDAFPYLRQRARRQERLFGVQTAYLPPSFVDLDGERSTALVAGSKGWKEVVLSPSPRIFHNLLTNPLGTEGRALRALNGDLRVVLFNETNRWHRNMLYGILSTNPNVKPYLPALRPYSHTNPQQDLFAMDQDRPKLLLTARRSLPQMAYLIDQSGLIRPIGKTSGTSLESMRWMLTLPGSPYVPAGFTSPMDWRLFIIREGNLGNWSVPGWVAKCESLSGSSSWTFAKALHQIYGRRAPEIQGQMYHVGMSIADTLSRFMPGIAHFAADFWIDQAGQPFLVDLSGRFRYDWVRRIGDWQALESLTNHPVKFALALQGTGVGKLHVDFGRIGENPR